MSLDRRSLLKQLTVGTAGALFAPGVWPIQAAAAEGSRGPKRVVFFLQNHGFWPDHALPDGVDLGPAPKLPDSLAVNPEIFGGGSKLDKVVDVPLASLKLPKFIDALEPYKDRLTIVQGLNGKHIDPTHGAPYGALGGFRKSTSVPKGETIDCALSRALSPAVVPLLVLGWDTLSNMQGNPIYYASSAWGASQPVPMLCNPLLAHKSLFGPAKAGKDRQEFEAETELYDIFKRDAARMDARLAGSQRDLFRPYLEGHEEAGVRQRKLLAMASVLEKHAPALTDKFTKPRFETDWWDASLNVGIGALTSGVTNVLTISSGLCSIGSSWIGLGCKMVGHHMGHTKPMENPEWLAIRRSNMDMLVQIIKALVAQPEGKGTMMDNTLIVYTSDAAEHQHCTGNRWPFLLLGNLGGTMRTGRYLQYPMEPKPQSRTINALYTTLLHAVGAPRDRFNLDGGLKSLDRAGPMTELLA